MFPVMNATPFSRATAPTTEANFDTHRIFGMTSKPNVGPSKPNVGLYAAPKFSAPEDSTDEDISTTVCEMQMGNRMRFLEEFEDLYTETIPKDIIFRIGDRTVAAHMTILSRRSSVFQKMFKHEMVEKTTREVAMEDIGFAMFDMFLKFVYSGRLENVNDLGSEDVSSLYALGDKYDVPSLCKVCLKIMSADIHLETVFDYLAIARKYGDEESEKKAKLFATKNFRTLVLMPAWGSFVASKPDVAAWIVKNAFSVEHLNSGYKHAP